MGTFLVPGGSPGIEITGRWDQVGLRASGSHEVTFRAVEVPYEHVIGIGPYGPAAEQDNRAGAALHLPLAALYLGVARAAQAFFHTIAHARVPANLGHPVARTERFRRTAGEIEVLLTAAERLVFDGCARLDSGDTSYTPVQALGARVLADRHGVRAVERSPGDPQPRKGPVRPTEIYGLASSVRTPSDVSVSGWAELASMVSDSSSAGHCAASAASGTRR